MIIDKMAKVGRTEKVTSEHSLAARGPPAGQSGERDGAEVSRLECPLCSEPSGTC